MRYENSAENVKINIYDLPGFDDNRGPETDIKNCIEIQSMIKKGSRFMKLILILDYNDLFQSRFLNLIGLLKTITETFPKIEEIFNGTILIVS